MNQNTPAEHNDYDTPVVEKKKGLSIIWLLPLIAAAIGGWLIYKSIIEGGIPIYITFDSAEGIEEGKTKVFYKGITAGVVKNISISDDLRTAEVMVEMDRKAKRGLTDKTLFWLVKPQVSITGISGLETLVSGNYIGVQPSREGQPQRHFTALKTPPPLDEDAPGLHIKLNSAKLGSLNRGSPVYYRQVTVGEVQDYGLTDHDAGILFSIHIDEAYTHLVKKNSRFWNASGITVKAGLTGVSIRTESLASVLAGGIAFDTPDDNQSQPSQNGDTFQLYNDFESADIGIMATIHFADGNGLEEGSTTVKYNGHTVGQVKKIHIPKNLSGVIAEVMFKPHAGHLLKTGTQFWLARPRFSLSGLSGLSTLFKGSHIELRPGQGTPSRAFTALANPPITTSDAPGLRLVVRAEDLGSLQRGSPVLYKKIPVGDVQDFNLSKDGSSVVLNLYVAPQYAHLVRANARFWNASGIDVSAGIDGLDIRTESLTSLVGGGIAFFSPESQPSAAAARNSDEFVLYDNYQSATDNGDLLYTKQLPGLHLKIITKQLGSLQRGSQVYYKKIAVGEVKGYALDQDKDRVIVSIHIKKKYARLVKKQSRFWNGSGISVEAGLSGVTVKTESVSAILSGGIAFFTPDGHSKTAPARNGDTFPLYDDFESAAEQSTPIEIRFSDGEGLAKGTVIQYQGLTVGTVRSVKLAEDATGVDVAAVLFGSAQRMARVDSRFWVVGAELSITRTAHLDTLIKGRYIAIQPGIGASASRFIGLDHTPVLRREASGLNITLTTDRLGSIKQGNNIFYRQVPVGQVLGFELATTANHVLIHINIAGQYAALVREHSEFWNASGITVDAGLFSGVQVDTESLEAIIGGGIAFATPNNASMGRAARSGQMFTLHDKPNEAWFTWAPAIQLNALDKATTR